ncbi:MAG: DNA replication and repair protein RecF, partial [Gemmatimonadaceae bacterium]|nr:DNA replication and repair protein RecF [Chitinophagaceae bacterium]
MLQLNFIQLIQFKNYENASFSFTARIIGICGNNGIGKTNLLDAIHYLSFTKSYFSKTDAQNVKTGAQGFRIAGEFSLNNENHSAACILRETGKKEFLVDQNAYDKFAAHIGRFPLVFIAPDDVHIITGGSEERRRYMDALISQADQDYLRNLIDYNRVMQQRNSHLKSIAESRVTDHSLLDVYDRQLSEHGNHIFEKRQSFLTGLIPVVRRFYTQIAKTDENTSINYQSAIHEKPLAALLKAAREKDLQMQRTTQGIHRDDLEINLGDKQFKSIASQGQRKSMLFALKLAEFDTLKNFKGYPPLLLLDDVFENLDEERMENLLAEVCIKNQGQIFITDTHY